MNNLARWNPFRELEDVSEHLNNLFGRSLPSRILQNEEQAFGISQWSPSVDIIETPQDFQVKAELPEVKKEDIHVNLTDGVLHIEGERKQEREEKDKKFHRIERFYGSFKRSFTIPANIDESKIRAEFKDGLLSIHLPKAEKNKPKGTEIKVS